MLESREMTEEKTGRQSIHHRWLTSRKILNVEELETVPPVTEPKNITQSITGGEMGPERGSARRSSLKGRTREGHRQPDEHWNLFSGTLGKPLRDGVECTFLFLFFPERIDTILN